MSIVNTFESQCRALCSAASPDENASRFLVGTQAPGGQNLVYLFEYKDDNSNLAKVSFKFPYGECWHLSTSNKYPNLVTAVTSGQATFDISLFKLPHESENPIEDDYGMSDSPIEKSFDLIKQAKSPTRQCLWHPDDGDKLLTCNDGILEFWDVDGGQKVQEFSLPKALQEQGDSNPKVAPVTDLRWSSLFNSKVVAASMGSHVYGIDTRVPDSSSSAICWIIEDQKCNRIRSIDFNPNSQYYLASGGDSCQANFWDLRQTNSPALHLQAHTHWIWSIRYNPFHDQLVLSGGSDARVALMRAQSIASEPFGQMADFDDDDGDSSLGKGAQSGGEESILTDKTGDEGGDKQEVPGNERAARAKDTKKLEDAVINVYEEHDDSVYAVEWATDPWIFASLGYESRLVINKVPKSEKLNILF